MKKPQRSCPSEQARSSNDNKKLKNGRAADVDNIQAELLKSADSIIVLYYYYNIFVKLTNMCNMVHIL